MNALAIAASAHVFIIRDQVKFESGLQDSRAVGDRGFLEIIFRLASVLSYIDAITLCRAVNPLKNPVAPHPLPVAFGRDQYMRLERDACMRLT